jgi:hypothetical protein
MRQFGRVAGIGTLAIALTAGGINAGTSLSSASPSIPDKSVQAHLHPEKWVSAEHLQSV